MDRRCPACGTRFGRELQKGVGVGIATLMPTLTAENGDDGLVRCAGNGDLADATDHVVGPGGKTPTLAGFSHALSGRVARPREPDDVPGKPLDRDRAGGVIGGRRRPASARDAWRGRACA